MNKTDQKLTLVVPTYNEAANIEELCRLLVGELSANNIDFEIIVVDDNSPDGTWKIVQGISEKDQRIRVIRRCGQKGLATAVISGWKEARGNILGVIDGDLQQPPATIPSLLNKLNGEVPADIVIASRNIKGEAVSSRSIWRSFVSNSGAFVSRFLLPRTLAQVSDPMSGFFILRREVINNKELNPLGYKILLEVLVKGDYKKLVEVPYVFAARKKGGSKAGIRQYFISLAHLISLSMQSKRG